MDSKIYRLCLIRPHGTFVPKTWDDFPECGIIMQVSRRLVDKEYAAGYCFSRNARLRQSGRSTCVVVMAAGEKPRLGEFCEMDTPNYRVA